jgi:hypothetical protein
VALEPFWEQAHVQNVLPKFRKPPGSFAKPSIRNCLSIRTTLTDPGFPIPISFHAFLRFGSSRLPKNEQSGNGFGLVRLPGNTHAYQS